MAAVLAALLVAGAPAAAAGRDYTQRATFDALDQGFRHGRGASESTNDQGALAWGESYFLQSYLLMYEATGDRRYLEKLVAHGDRVLARRDSERGVTDWLGRSLPAWRTANPYTVGSGVLADAEGRPVLELRSALPAASRSRVTVAPGSTPGAFRLHLDNTAVVNRRPSPCGPEGPAPAATFDDVTLRRGDPSYVVDVVNAAFGSTPMQATARDVRADPGTAAVPSPGTFTFRSLPYVHPVHTGQITYPLARFVRLVRETPALAAVPRYADAAKRYLDAVEQAVAVHDPDWRVGAGGEGGYVFPRGAPVRFDGTEAPLNQSLAMGRTLYELALVTGRADYRDKVAALARTLRADLAPDPRGSYVWTYSGRTSLGYRGWSLADRPSEHTLWSAGFRSAEDAGHGWIDVAFAADLHRRPVGPAAFGAADMAALAATFTRNLATTGPDGAPSVWDKVDGTGCVGVYDTIAAAWMPLADWDRGVFDHVRASFDARQPAGTAAAVVFGCANLSWFAARMPPSDGRSIVGS